MRKTQYNVNTTRISFEQQRAHDHEKHLKDKAQRDARQYQRDRSITYPDLRDQLDAIWKHLLYCRDTLNQPLHPETNRMLERILAVKTQYPKPNLEK